VLARAEVENPAQLRADLQQFYSLNLDDMGGSYSYEHAAALVANLPRSSRMASIFNAACEWDDSEYLLFLIEYNLRVISWQLGGCNGSQPRPISTPAEMAERKRKVADSDRAFIDSILKGGVNE
jgi:hypothetical protein